MLGILWLPRNTLLLTSSVAFSVEHPRGSDISLRSQPMLDSWANIALKEHYAEDCELAESHGQTLSCQDLDAFPTRARAFQ